MTEPFVGEIRLFAFNTIPSGWMRAEGQELQINQNQALYTLLQTQFGGNGQTTFKLPDLRGRTPVCATITNQGQSGGTDSVVLTPTQIPPHTHAVNVSSGAGAVGNPAGGVLATNTKTAAVPIPFPVYAAPSNAVPLAPTTIQPSGAGQGHDNRQPSLALAYCIAIRGLYPARP